MGQRITGMTSGQKSLPCAAPQFTFARHGKAGTWVSELLPHTASVIDEVAVVRSVHSEAINHDPAITFIQTGSQQPGRPSLGSWLSYGIGNANKNLPAFVVKDTQGDDTTAVQPPICRVCRARLVPTEQADEAGSTAV